MDPKEFGVFIQTRRKELGMNQTQLAEKLNVTAKAVSRWERGVGFPSIELLQPLAEALEISIAELMQSKLLEKEIPKEEASQLVTQTMETIRQQEALTWKRKIILYGGYALFFAMYSFLYIVGIRIRFESKWTGLAVSLIGLFLWHFGSRALYCLLTGEPFLEPPEWRVKKKWQYYAALAEFALGIAVVLAALAWCSVKSLRDFLAVAGLMTAFFSVCYISIFEEELNK